MNDRQWREWYLNILNNSRERVNKPFDRTTAAGVREIGFYHWWVGKPESFRWEGGEHVIWEIYPDGSAKYVNKMIPTWAIFYQDYVGTIPDDPRVRTPQAIEENRNRNYPKTTWDNYKTISTVPPEKGSPVWTYNFTPDNFKIFKMAASIPISRIAGTPDAERELYLIQETGYYRKTWGNWWLPDQAEDAEKMKKWILSLSPTEVFGLYYSLVMFTGPKINGCNTREYSPLITPIEFKENGLWSIFQEMIFRALYHIRTDLHQIKDPQTGKMITGLINYEEFRMACDAPKWMSIIKWVGVVGDLAMAFVTLGASTAFQAVSFVVKTAITIVNLKDANNQIKAMVSFNNKLVDGYNAAQDPANIVNTVPIPKEDLIKPQPIVDLVLNPNVIKSTASDSQPVDEKQTNTLSLLGILVLGYYLLS